MKTFFLILILFLTSLNSYAQKVLSYPIKTANLNEVNFTGGFWQQRYDTNIIVTIPFLIKEIKKTGRVANMEFAAGIKKGVFCTRYQFDDSDIYKTIEAASYDLAKNKNIKLKKQVDTLINIIVKAQTDDGYLYSPRSAPSKQIKKVIGPKRWSDLRWSHELYVLGHLYEAAVAYYRATGEKSLLNVALKNAALILKDFNPHALQIPPGHEEIEIGLVKLYLLTGEKKYLNEAKFFLDIRGRGPELTGRKSWGDYAQDQKPVTEQTEAVGHAVRAAYLYSAMTDIAALTGNKDYLNAVNKLWQNVTYKKLYVTGGIGSTGWGEALGKNYDLPNASAYNETCSSVALMLWNYRMFLMTGNAKYLDVFERTLYNAFLSGISIQGNSFFYSNPLQSFGSESRSHWFTCACCPPNAARFIASLPSRVYASDKNSIYVNLYCTSNADLMIGNSSVNLKQETNYPWGGNINLFVNPEKENENFTVKLRIPSWSLGKPLDGNLYKFVHANGSPVIKINNKKILFKIEKGFVSIKRNWKKNDHIELILPMEIHRVIANDSVDADKGMVVLQRGPVVYCVEWPENKDSITNNILLPDNEKLTSEFKPGLLNGLTVIKGDFLKYKFVDEHAVSYKEEIEAIPYYAWAHRGKGEMNVWLAREKSAVTPANGPGIIAESMLSSSPGKNIKALNDLADPENSKGQAIPFFVFNKDTGDKWVQIDFPKLSEISAIKIYWVKNNDSRRLKVPLDWKVQFMQEDNNWGDVYATSAYSVKKNEYSNVSFETVRTKSIRIKVTSQKNSDVGIYEIKTE